MSGPDDTRYYEEIGHLWPYDIDFDPGNRRHVWVDDSIAHFRVATEPGFTEVTLVCNRLGDVEGVPMRRWAATRRFDHWEAEADGTEAFDYSLALRHESGEVVYVTQAGVAGAIERLDRWTFLPEAATVAVPSWMRGSVIYQIYPERFANGDPTLTPEPSAEWGSPPDNYLWQGGDLIGVRAHLDHLQRLGVDCIYLNPIFSGPSTHNYDAVDFRRVDPTLGGNEALADLVTDAHRTGIRVILDTSFNHAHPRFFAFDDVVRRGQASSYATWFVVHDYPLRIKYRPHVEVTERYRWYLEHLEELTGLPVEIVDGEGPAAEPTYDAWYGVPTMPRIDLSNPEARAYFLETARFWLEDFDIDGYRMDVTRYVDADFWNDFHDTCRSAKPDCYLLCEIFGDAGPWLQGDRFDATMNYTFRQLAVDFLGLRRIDAPTVAEGITRMLALYAGPIADVNQNLLSSHDVPRFLTLAEGDRRALLLATVLQFTLPGAPGLYYGDEVGMVGGEDPDQRGAFPWHQPNTWLTSQLDAVQELSGLRRASPALKQGDWMLLTAFDRTIAYRRSRGEDSVVTVINDGDALATVETSAVELLWGQAAVNKGRITVPPRSAAILR